MPRLPGRACRSAWLAPANPDRTVFLGLLAREMSGGIAVRRGSTRGYEKAGAAVAISTAVPRAYLTLAARKQAMAHIGQTQRTDEDALIVAVGAALLTLATRPKHPHCCGGCMLS